jgi:hypothetical protein
VIDLFLGPLEVEEAEEAVQVEVVEMMIQPFTFHSF